MSERSNRLSRREFLAASGGAAALSLADGEPRASAASRTASRGRFPKDFVWGAATAAYQVEGSPTRDGGGASVWDTFCTKPGAVWEGHSGEIACDHYTRYREDVALMKRLGLKAYRFSISWPRVLPSGTGQPNTRGLDFYDRLVDELLAARITPYVTLFHWDLPEALYQRGGWSVRDSADWFADYASLVSARLSDRVTQWMTLNEPQVYIGLGHQSGVHAPGERRELAPVLQMGHHTLLAHGKATQALRASSRQPCRIGFVPVGIVKSPATESPQDLEAARTAMFRMDWKGIWHNTWWMDPVFLGHYPEDGLKLFGQDAPTLRDGDLETIHQPLDFFAVNIYHGERIRARPDGGYEGVKLSPSLGRTANAWPVTPEALYWGPRFLWERYGKPILIAENGLANTDWVALDGKVHDPQRIDFTRRYLLELRRAAEDGVDVLGYFHWSLFDNFEWAEGYKHRFGLVYVDFETQERIPKDSAGWYREVIRTNGASLGRYPSASDR